MEIQEGKVEESNIRIIPILKPLLKPLQEQFKLTIVFPILTFFVFREKVKL